MELELLWHDLYSKTLKSVGLIINTYDRCIASSIMYNKQFTISCYVNDNKMSHVEGKLKT